ncbi:hypothetical protein ACFXPA_40370, partial [Amycolatopsis sp. NPDC059090]
MTVAVLSPGQGSQAPGMLAPWLELDGARARVEEWSARSGLDLIRLGTEAGAEEIQDTAVAQPLIVALSLLSFEHLPGGAHPAGARAPRPALWRAPGPRGGGPPP